MVSSKFNLEVDMVWFCNLLFGVSYLSIMMCMMFFNVEINFLFSNYCVRVIFVMILLDVNVEV